MQNRLLIAVIIMVTLLGSPVLKLRASQRERNADEIAARIIDAATEAFAGPDWGPKWDVLDARLGRLLSNQTKQADEAVVILGSFYLGEHNGEELNENILNRGPRMIPLLKLYLDKEPVSLLKRYPKRVKLDRSTTVMFFKEDIETLLVKAGARRVAKATFETEPLLRQSATCTPKLVQHPQIEPGEVLVRPGESFSEPVLRAEIVEDGEVADIKLLSSSGLRRLDAILSAPSNHWKFAPRPDCDSITADIGVSIDWIPPN